MTLVDTIDGRRIYELRQGGFMVELRGPLWLGERIKIMSYRQETLEAARTEAVRRGPLPDDEE